MPVRYPKESRGDKSGGLLANDRRNYSGDAAEFNMEQEVDGFSLGVTVSENPTRAMTAAELSLTGAPFDADYSTLYRLTKTNRRSGVVCESPSASCTTSLCRPYRP